MSDRDKILQAIYRAVNEANGPLPADRRLRLSPDTVLVGPAATLDSLGLINLIVAVEQQVADVFGRNLDLTATALLNPEEDLPTLGHLSETVERILSEAPDG